MHIRRCAPCPIGHAPYRATDMAVYRIADLNVGYTPVSKAIAALSEPYRISDAAQVDIQADVTQEDIAAEYGFLPDSTPETAEYTAIYRKLCTKMLDYNGFLFHSSTVVLDGEAYAFTALSGTGKSTHTRLWLRQFGDRAYIINDDKPIVRFTDGVYNVYGTPWSGKDNLNRNAKAPLKAVCFLHRGEENSITPKVPSDALVPLLNQVYRPHEEEYTLKFLDELDRFLKSVKFYDLYCNMSLQAAQVAYDGMK